MFVHPSQVAELALRFPELANVRLVVLRAREQDALRLDAECASAGAGLEQAIAQALRDITKLGGEVLLVPPGTLAPDGRAIIDMR